VRLIDADQWGHPDSTRTVAWPWAMKELLSAARSVSSTG